MNENEINFRQEREFGELFNATFAFIRNEFKTLGKAILYFVVPFLIIASIAAVYAGLGMQKSVAGIQSEALGGGNPSEVFGSMPLGSFFISFLAIIIASTTLVATVLGYIKLYVSKGKGNFSLQEHWTVVVRNFFPVLGASIVAGIVIVIGMMFCFVPGIYLGVSLCLILPIMVIEGKGFGEAFSKSFKLTKPNFWMILGGLFVIMLIYYVLSLIFSIPASVLGFKNLFIKAMETDNFEFDLGISYYIANGIATLLTYIANVIPTIFIAFIYYSQLEQLEKPSLEEKIEQISSDE